MVESNRRSEHRPDPGEAIRRMLDSGMSEREIHQLVTTTATALAEPPTENDGTTIFEELPKGMIDVRSAAQKYDLRRRTITTWIQRGRLQSYGRLRAPARGGGYHIVNEQELRDWLDTPRDKGGRPPGT